MLVQRILVLDPLIILKLLFFLISIEPQALLTIILFKNVTFQVLQIKLFNTSIHLNFVPPFLCQPTGFCIHKILPKKEKKNIQDEF